MGCHRADDRRVARCVEPSRRAVRLVCRRCPGSGIVRQLAREALRCQARLWACRRGQGVVCGSARRKATHRCATRLRAAAVLAARSGAARKVPRRCVSVAPRAHHAPRSRGAVRRTHAARAVGRCNQTRRRAERAKRVSRRAKSLPLPHQEHPCCIPRRNRPAAGLATRASTRTGAAGPLQSSAGDASSWLQPRGQRSRRRSARGWQ